MGVFIEYEFNREDSNMEKKEDDKGRFIPCGLLQIFATRRGMIALSVFLLCSSALFLALFYSNYGEDILILLLLIFLKSIGGP